MGNERSTDIQESIPGISPKVLAKELKDLEQHQLIRRTVAGDPVKVSYAPAPYSNTLTPIIKALKEWGINHRKRLFEANGPKYRRDHAGDGPKGYFSGRNAGNFRRQRSAQSPSDRPS